MKSKLFFKKIGNAIGIYNRLPESKELHEQRKKLYKPILTPKQKELLEDKLNK